MFINVLNTATSWRKIFSKQLQTGKNYGTNYLIWNNLFFFLQIYSQNQSTVTTLLLATIKISAIIIVSWFWYELFFTWILKTFLNYTTDKLILSLWNWRAYFILRNYLAWTCFSINHSEGKHAKYDGWRTCIFMEEILISKIYYSYKSYKYLNMKMAFQLRG